MNARRFQDIKLVNGPIKPADAAGVGDADELGLGNFGEHELGDARRAFAFEHGFVPGFAILGNLNLPAARPVVPGLGGVEDDARHVGSLGQLDLKPHAGHLGCVRVPAGLGIAIDGFGQVVWIVAGGELPLFAVHEGLGTEALEFFHGPGSHAGGMLFAEFGDLGLLNEAAAVALWPQRNTCHG